MVKNLFSQEIIHTVKAGNLEKVKELIKEDKENLKIEDHNGYTAFHTAVISKKTDIAKYLADNGAEMSKPNKWNEYPIHHAVYMKSIELIKLFVEKKADLNIKNYRKDTPLDIANLIKHTEIIDFLMINGAVSSKLKTPLILKLSDKIYTITYDYGLHNNTLLCTGDKGNLIVDPAFIRTAYDLNKKIGEINKGEILYVINSHNHTDHVQANSCFPESILIRLDNLESLEKNEIITKIDKPIGKTDLHFKSYSEFDFDGEKIKIIPVPGTHSKYDIITYFSTSKVVYMGDLLLSESFPPLNRKIVEYLKIIDTTIDVFSDDTIFVPGHGKNLDKPGLIAYRKMLDKTIGIILKGKKRGKTISDLRKKRVLKEYESYNVLLDWFTTDFWIEVIHNNFNI